ncbi:MAG: DNA repair exonuclease [Coriobacteriia bacterium]|nr:DNA repair exonuclease [Coriobacteriia bacterium]
MADHLTFVHAADLHLDTPFRRVDAAEPRVRDACVESTFDAFDRIVDVCVERGAAFLVVAGDAFNTAERSFRAQSRFRAAAERLAETGVRVFLAGGNHDPASGGPVSLEMPENVHYFASGAVERMAFPSENDPSCVLYGRSFGRARETANLAREFRKADGDPFAIGVLHANVGGNQQYEPYAPCSLDDLLSTGMDYWALGHIHQHQVLALEPPVVYPGSPQGLDPNEAGEHGCVVVTVGSAGVSTEFVETGRIAWDRRSVDLADTTSLDDVLAALRVCCENARDAADGRPVLLRIDLVGRSEAHVLLAHGATFEELVAEVRAEQLAVSPWVWLDRVRDLTRPALDLDRVRDGADFAGDLVRIADEIGADEAAAMLDEVLDPIRGAARGVEMGFDAAALIERARDLCLDRLLAGEQGR